MLETTHSNSADVRWHHDLHPSVRKHHLRNGLPKFVQASIHPTYATLTREPHDEIKWRSRDHRKGRHLTMSPKSNQPRRGRTLWHKLANMRRIEYWNISWWVAMAFTWGSVCWVINGFAVFLPFCNSHFQTAPESSGWTAWLGATIFELGSIFGMWEAWNRNDVANFGWGVEKSVAEHIEKAEGTAVEGSPSDEYSTEHSQETLRPSKNWVCISFDGKYWHEIGFLAAFSQFCAATIFWISGFTAIPTIQSSIASNTALLNGVFWVPQVIGGTGFMISATFIMLEVQKKWYRPAPLSLGWQVGVWNFIGAVGFTLSGAFGFAAANSTGAEYQSALSTFWGGWAFLIGSIIQWYESVNSI